MTTVIINEKTKEGKAILEFLRKTKYVTVIESNPVVNGVVTGLKELIQARENKIETKSVHKLIEEL
jgi:hypothetical protein